MFLLKTLLSLQSKTNKKEAALATSILFPSNPRQSFIASLQYFFLNTK
jgi:hypothetical protein